MVHQLRDGVMNDEERLAAIVASTGNVMNPKKVAMWARNSLRNDIVKVTVSDAGQVDGFIAYRINKAGPVEPAHVYIRRFFVHQDCQGKGLGRMLLDEAYKVAREESLHVKTPAVSADAKALFESKGFIAHTYEARKGSEHERWLRADRVPAARARTVSKQPVRRSIPSASVVAVPSRPPVGSRGTSKGQRKPPKKTCCVM